MANSYYGSIDLDELKKLINNGSIKTYKSFKSGKEYVNCTIYVNDNADKFGNFANLNIVFNDGKEEEYNGKKIKYKSIGSFKKSDNKPDSNKKNCI